MPLNLENEAELRKAQAELFNASSATGWVLLNYVGPSTVHFTASSKDGVENIKEHFCDDQIQYALIRLDGIQEKNTSKTNIRDIFVCWIGPQVGLIEKGKKTSFFQDASNYLYPHHSSITVINREKFTRETVLDRSDPLSGSNVIG